MRTTLTVGDDGILTFSEELLKETGWKEGDVLQWIDNHDGSWSLIKNLMKEFDYDLDYKTLDFTDDETRKLYRIGRGEQGVLLVRPYTEEICKHWRFKNVPTDLLNLLIKFTRCSATTGGRKISLVWTWRGNSLRWDLRGQDAMLTTKPGESTLYLKKFSHKKMML